MVIVKSVIALAASEDWSLYQMDVFNTFLHGDLYEEVYMDVPQDFRGQGKHKKVYKLLKSLYGLKQTSRQRNLKLTKTLAKTDFCRSSYDYFMLIYVDDLLFIGRNKNLIDEANGMLNQEFKV